MDPRPVTQNSMMQSDPQSFVADVLGTGASFAPQESERQISIETFFLNDAESSMKTHPQEDRRVYIESRSRKQHFDFEQDDIVFLHSHGANRYDTWRCGDVFWPDYIVDDFPGARALLFNYDTKIWTHFGVEDIEKTARNLVRVLGNARQGDYGGKPIVFIAHSLAGFLLKAACIECMQDSEDLIGGSILHSTRGVIFLGTPHRSVSVGGWQPILQRVHEVAGTFPESSANLDAVAVRAAVDVLSKFYSALEATKMRIFSFFEQYEASGGSLPILATSFENGLHHPCETRETLPGNHVTMCQFESRLDPGYRMLSNAIQAILSAPGNLDVSISNTPVALLPSRMELSTVFAVQDLLSSKTLHKSSDQDDNATLVPPSIMYQFAPTVKLRRLKRLLAFPQSYVTDDLSMRSRDTLSKTEWVVNSHGFREWLDSDSLLIIRGPRGSGKSTLAYRIAHFLGVEQEEDLEDSPRRCVLSYFYRNTLGSDHVIVQMLNQFLLQFLEIMPALARHFPNHRVFGRARPSWPEWDEQNWTAYDEDSKKMCLDLDTLSRGTESTRGLSSKDLLISPLTVPELVEILISIIHDELVGEVIMVIDGLDDSPEISQSLFQRFLELIESMRSKQVKVCLSCDTAQIHSLKHTVDLDTLHNFEPVLQTDENLDILFRSVHEKYRVIPSRNNELMLLAGKIRSICMRSHLAVSLARQILGGLSSLDDMKAFTATLEECRMGHLEPETEIDKLYHWAFDHLIILRGWRHMSLLFLIAVAERPLNLAEANALVPSPSEFASWCDEDYKMETTLLDEGNTSKPFPKTDTMQGVHALESKLLGLVRISNGTLTLFHPDLKTFLLQKLSDRHLRFHLHYHIGIACLTLLQDLIQGSSQMTYDLESQRYTLPVENFSYPLRYWNRHVSVAESSDQWSNYHSVRVLSLLAGLWDNAEVRDLIHGFSPARLPPVPALSMPCILAAHDLANVLEVFYVEIPGQLPRRDMNPSLEQRCAVVNSGSKAQAVIQRYRRESASSDQYGRTLDNYKVWAKSRHDAEQLLLPDWIREAIGIDKMGKCDWGTVRGIAKNALEHKKLSKDHFEQLLVLAVHRNDVELVADLLDDGARCHYIDKDDPRKPSVYHIAASIGNTDLVQELIRHASLYCATDTFGMRPIHWAVERGHHEIVELLVTATLNQDERGQIPLFMACEGVSPTTVLAVLKQGFPPSFTDKLNRTPMHVASSIGATDVVQLLLSKGGNPEAQDDKGITPLHLAAFGGWTGVVDELLASRVFTDVTTNDQQTPLHFACESPNPSLEVGVEELLKLAQQNQEITRIIQQYHGLFQITTMRTVINQGKFVPELQSKINVVFVHGYYESPTKTWSDGSAPWLWPTKYLPGSELQARVFFWDRQLELTDFSGAANFSELGTKLLDFVRSTVYAPELSSKSGKTMPLVFVSQSLGGLVVKAALAGAVRKNDSCLRAIKGLVFLGTPYQELDENSPNDAVQRLVQAAIDNRLDPGRNNSLSGRTKLGFANPEQTEAYNKLDLDFGGICRRLHIKMLSITETLGQFTSLDGIECKLPDAENVSVDKDHGSLPRLSCTDDVVYGKMVEFLHEVLIREKQSESRIADLPDRQDDYNYVSKTTSPQASFSQPCQPKYSEKDIILALQTDSSDYIPLPSDTVASSLLNSISGFPKKPVNSKITEWLNNDECPYLWIRGNAGSGKTVLMAELYHHLIQSSGAQSQPGTMANQTSITGFFFNGRLQGQKTANDMLRSVLYHIFIERSDLVNLLIRDGDIIGTDFLGSHLSWATLSSVFEKTVEVASDTRFILFLDALDECGPETENDSNYLYRVSDLQSCSSPSAEFSEVAQLRMEDLNSSDIVRGVEQRLLLTGGFSEVTLQRMNHFSSSDIVKYVEQRLANGEVNQGLVEDVIRLSWGVMLQTAPTVDKLIQHLKDDLDFNDQIVRAPEFLETLYERMLDDIPSHYKKEAARILRIVAIAPFQLDIDLLCIAVEDYIVDPEISIQEAPSDLVAINAKYGYDEPKRSESAHGERRLKATRRMNRRCGGLLSIQDGNDIRFIHGSVGSFLSKPQNSQGLLGESTDARFEPSVSLLSACIIRLKQNLDEEWQSKCSNVDYTTLINNLVTQALAAASLADNGPGALPYYTRLFNELSLICLRIQRLQPLPTSPTYKVPVPDSFNGITHEHYRVLLAIKAELWWYLRNKVNKYVVMLKDGSNVSLLTHLINTKGLATLPWATTIRDSRNLPPSGLVESFFICQADPNDGTPDRNVWREVLEAGYHVFALDTVPSNPGPAQTYENKIKWVAIMELFLEYGADVNASFPETRFDLRDPPADMEQTTSLRFKTLEPEQTLRDVLSLNSEYNSDYRYYLRIIEEKRNIQPRQVAEAPTSPQLMPVSATPGSPKTMPEVDHLSQSSTRSCSQSETGGVRTIYTEEGQPPGDHAQRRTSRSVQEQPSEESQPEQEVQRDRWFRLRQGILRFRRSRTPSRYWGN
ncbi:Ankyrin [Metarhizium guizhouense ARSEF 977]|uniref:Ankyrin n=1 Tax=Metarhizium guizhouense (strain ARSEF 977) TaxID=1276136 RepID=A0A0B4GAH2_METGA|nr:Ankyrin [Metarhizium guizhouense ARSEF 977]